MDNTACEAKGGTVHGNMLSGTNESNSTAPNLEHVARTAMGFKKIYPDNLAS